MAGLIYTASMSLDGYTVDSTGNFDWAAPSEEVHAFINDLERAAGTYLYGRRMYETMQAWQTMPTGPQEPAVVNDYADLWRAADKIVYSSTITEPSTPRTRIEARFDPHEVSALVESSDRPVSIGGPTLAAEAFRSGLIDEVRVFLVPVSVGGGTPALPHDQFVQLETREQRRFAGGTVFLRYDVGSR